ncbi:MAG: phenylalanine--tRNA ligase subunit beta, partial [Candidatus Parcubacteria bacterium]|nr:phenylalanine--tRNA ligase subunit beta [Candidatus Parcubacteria bacterium]
MKLSYQWLKELVSFKESPEQLAKLLTMQVAQIEGVTKLGDGLDKVIAAKIIDIKKHPNADKLQIVLVQINEQGEKLTIVCGAPNIKVGQMVPLALPGARLPNGMEIKEAEIRGVKSVGMLCAEDELGLGPDHLGIYILPDKVKSGELLIKLLQLDDAILEVENKSITHRPDLFSVNGFAQEISAIKGLKRLSSGKRFLPKKSGKKLNPVKIQVKDGRL